MVAIRGGRIIAAGARTMFGYLTPTAVRRIDFGRAVILPGLVNAHAHLEYTHAGPIAGDGRRDFARWIAELVAWSWRISPDARLASARAGAEAMLRAGMTCVGDIVTRGQGAQAMAESGLHGVAFCEVVGGYPADDPPDFTARMSDLIDRASAAAARVPGRIRVGVSPHAPYTVSETVLRQVTSLARARGWPLACHLSESTAEAEFLAHGTGELAEFMGEVLSLGRPLRPEARRGSPLDYAAAGGLLPGPAGPQGEPGMLLIHGAHLKPPEIARLAAAGAAVVMCPRSNELLSVGAQVPVGPLARSGIVLGVGTDSLGSNTGLDLFAELRALRDLWTRQEPGTDRDQMAERLLHMATAEGAAALGLAGELGSLTAGKRADLTITDLPPARITSGLVEAVVGGLDAGAVIATFTDGCLRYQRDAESGVDGGQ